VLYARAVSEPSPSERELATKRSLELFPDISQRHFQRTVAAPQVEANPALGVLVVLRDVRDPAHAPDERRAWLVRAHETARTLSMHAWFDVFLAIVRHALLVGETQRAKDLAVRLVDAMSPQPPEHVLQQCTHFRDAIYRALQAVRVPLLANTIGLSLPDVVPKIVDLARSDRTLLAVHRNKPLPQLVNAVIYLEGTTDLVADFRELFPKGAKPGEPVKKPSKASLKTFKPELAKDYIADAVFEWGRAPMALG
jgi:hypothetical protein